MLPPVIPNWINGVETPALGGAEFTKLKPADGLPLCRVAASASDDVAAAVAAARAAQTGWGNTPAVQRGMTLLGLVRRMQDETETIARIVALETGKSVKDARGETAGAIQLGLFYAGEAQRLYGRTTTSGTVNKYALTIRQPIGVAGLIIAANTPIANVAWKVFPALVCGNSAVLKAAEDTPGTAWYFGRLAGLAGLPAGVLNIVQGSGPDAGAPLVDHPDVGVISFTGSTRVGQIIHRQAGARLARLSLELGGKNPLVVCDDADLDQAVKWTLLSAFSNAGQRCAAASRILVFDTVYEEFRHRLLDATRKLRIGPADSDDFGPVINERQRAAILRAVEQACSQGATLLHGGRPPKDKAQAGGFYIEPTVLENVSPEAFISCTELFGPVTILYRVQDYAAALAMANSSPYGLTACIHTRSVNRALHFAHNVQAGVAVINAGTFGSEPHMPFGGRKLSGNGSREPGTEALDIYSELKDIYLNVDSAAL